MNFLKSLLCSFLFLMAGNLLCAAAAGCGISVVSKEDVEAIKLGDMNAIKSFVKKYGVDGTIFNDKSCCSILQLVLDTSGIPQKELQKVLKAKLEAVNYLIKNGAQSAEKDAA